MRYLALLFPLFFLSCDREPNKSSFDPVNWSTRPIDLQGRDSLRQGTSYLSVYSSIYSLTEQRTHNLTVTVSIRNTSLADSVFILRADYYNTQGDLIRTYFEEAIYVKPLETVEIVIDEHDEDGGTGANFIFEWATDSGRPSPLFEAVMISTSGQQGLSFTTQGVEIMR